MLNKKKRKQHGKNLPGPNRHRSESPLLSFYRLIILSPRSYGPWWWPSVVVSFGMGLLFRCRRVIVTQWKRDKSIQKKNDWTWVVIRIHIYIDTHLFNIFLQIPYPTLWALWIHLADEFAVHTSSSSWWWQVGQSAAETRCRVVEWQLGGKGLVLIYLAAAKSSSSSAPIRLTSVRVVREWK
jgi:hypothetical protein